jgi:Na+/H+ antiporter NhaD/arsenite permease-like protein
MTVVFSAVLNNVTAMIIVGSLTAVSLGRLKSEDKLLGFLLIEGLLTNIGGLLTLISSVPNIIVGNTAGISFARFFIVSSPYVVVATAATIFLGARLYGIRSLESEEERASAHELVSGFDERDGIKSPQFFLFGAIMTVLFIATIASTSVIPFVQDLGMGFVAIAFGVAMLVRYKSTVDRFYKALDWDLLMFFTFLFVVINVMEHAQVLALVGHGLKALIGLGPELGPAATLVSSAVFSAVTDNIPLAAMLAKILAGLHAPSSSPLWWSVIFGANLGGNLTPIGSASTVVAVTIMHKHGVPISFGGFVKAALPYAAVQIAVAVVYVLFALPMVQ